MKGTPAVAGQSVALWLAALLAVSALAGCSSDGKGTPAWTAQPDPSSSAPGNTSQEPGSTGTSAPPSGSTGSPTPGTEGSPSPGATALAWKTYSDASKRVSFELPQDWIVQSVQPDQGSLPGAVKIEVKDAKGLYLATLQTGLPPASPVACAADAGRPYVVVSSVPVEVPHSDGEGTIAPRVVFRVIQGYKFFGSYGITNMVGGADGKACQLRNMVQGPAGKGDFYFGDLATLRAFAVDEKVAPAKSFDTLEQAAKYVNESSEFANVQRMLLSLKINL